MLGTLKGAGAGKISPPSQSLCSSEEALTEKMNHTVAAMQRNKGKEGQAGVKSQVSLKGDI